MAVAVACDLSEERAKSYSQEYGIPRWTTRYEQVLSDSGIDLILIVTAPTEHVPLSIMALEAGKPVFCEKPMSTNAAEREELRKALKATGGRLMCGYCYRFAPPFVKARELAAPAAFTAAIVLNNEKGGHNYLIHNASHAVDTVVWMHQSEVAEVAATGTRWEGQAHPSEQFVINLRFENGSLANVVCGGAGAGGMLPKWYYKTIGQSGRVAEVSCTRPGWSLWVDGHEGVHTCSDYYEGHRNEMRHFVRCLQTGEPCAVSPESSLRVDEVLSRAAAQLGFAN